jgi:hypothetical protein
LVVEIANDLRLRLQNNVDALNRTFDFPIHNHSLGGNSSGNMRPARNDERGAVQFAVDLTVDLDQAFGRDGPYNLQPLGDDRSLAHRRKHGSSYKKQGPT